MAHSNNKRKKVLQRLCIVAGLSIAVTGIGSVILAAAGVGSESLGTFLYQAGGSVFLFSMIVIFVALMVFRLNPPTEIRFFEDPPWIWISPIKNDESMTIPPGENPSQRIARTIAQRNSDSIRVISVQGHELDAAFFQEMKSFPNLRLLDVQNCAIEREAIDGIGELYDLEYLLVYRALDKTDALGLELLLPEVSIVYDSRMLGLINKPLERGEPPVQFKEAEAIASDTSNLDLNAANAGSATTDATGQLQT